MAVAVGESRYNGNDGIAAQAWMDVEFLERSNLRETGMRRSEREQELLRRHR